MCEIAMQSLIDDLPGVYHSQLLFDETAGLSVRPTDFDFTCDEFPTGVKVSSKTIQESDRKYVWAVIFDPPLKQQQRVRYGFRFTHRNDQPYTIEDVQKRIEAGTYPIAEKRCRALDWTINYPTRELSYELEFPQGYPLRDPRLDVRISNMGHIQSDIQSDEERDRILAERTFVVERVFDTWRARVRIRNPMFAHNYSISYEPPSAAEVGLG
jgi:hypothetical protein